MAPQDIARFLKVVPAGFGAGDAASRGAKGRGSGGCVLNSAMLRPLAGTLASVWWVAGGNPSPKWQRGANSHSTR